MRMLETDNLFKVTVMKIKLFIVKVTFSRRFGHIINFENVGSEVSKN